MHGTTVKKRKDVVHVHSIIVLWMMYIEERPTCSELWSRFVSDGIKGTEEILYIRLMHKFETY